MGSCLSKKSVCASSTPVAVPDPPEKLKSESPPEKKKVEEETVVKKEIFIIKHRKSHEVERQKPEEEKGEIETVEEITENGKNGLEGGGLVGAPMRTSSCTKEEVDAILIQCGRLSRSSSTGKAALSSENGGRKYSGSKRSYDFDNENGNNGVDGDDEAVARERENRRRERRRSNSQGRRRTPSREREKEQASQQRSGSRERGAGGGGRRVSRSPGRRSESPMSNSNSNSNSSAANGNCRPGKMVSVPASISSLAAMDKSSNGGETKTAIKRIEVKRNAGGEGGGRSTASPRARSPARVRATNEDNKPITLSRSNSRKAEISPFRRNPLGEIDTNIISQKPNSVTENKINISKVEGKNQEQQHLMGGHVVAMNVISAGPENPKANTLTRSRSSRLSRDLDIAPETLSNPNASYTALLLEDIQNFHQKNTSPPPFSLPPCLTKACSILEAVADLNSSIGSSNPITEPRKAKPDVRDPIVESEVVVNDDLMQPSFHKYVTVRRGTASGEEEDLEEQESSGSNSFAGSQQQWVSSSCWEPNSAESTDRWTTSSSSRTASRQNEVSPVGFQRLMISETGRGANEGGKKVSGVKKRGESDHQQNGIGRGRIATRGSHIAPSTQT